MAITIANQWTSGFGNIDAEILTAPTSGRWLIAVLTCRVTDGSAPLLGLGDPCNNIWTLVSDNTKFATSAHSSAQLQAEVWACPAVTYDGWPLEQVYASAMQIVAQDTGSVCVNIAEVSGMANGTLTVDSVTLGTASAAGSLALAAPTPGGSANCLMIAVAGLDSSTSVTLSGTGWTALTGVTNTNPTIRMASAWREATTSGTATFTLSSGTANWAGAVIAVRVTGTAPSQPNPAWPPTALQIGFGYDLSTPLSRVRWTDQTTRYLGLDTDHGIQAELGTAQQGNTTLVIRDEDGAYTPRTVATAASASANGTTTTIKIADANATAINKGDFFRLKDSTGALKELNVFQVTGLSSAAGTTTATFVRADGSGGGALASTATNDIYAGIQIDLYIPWRLLETVSSKTYCVASGWLLDPQIGWSDAHWGEVEAASADATETLSVAYPSALKGEIFRHRDLHSYWSLGDQSGVGYAANSGGVSNTPLTKTTSKFGAGASGTADFGASTQDVETNTTTTPHLVTSLLGDPGSGWSQTGQTATELNAGKGFALVGSDPNFPSITNGVTIIGSYVATNDQTTTITNMTTDPTIVICKNGDPGATVSAGAIIKLALNHTDYTSQIVVWDKDTHASTTTNLTGTDQIANGTWATWALAFNRTSWTAYVNGFQVGTGSCDLVANFSIIDFFGEADPFYNGRCLIGTNAHVMIYGRKLSAGEISDLGWIPRNGSPESVTSRIVRKINAVGWKGTRVLTPTSESISPEAAPSGTTMDLLSEIAGYQDSQAFVDAGSQFQFRDRVTAYQQRSRATLGEVAGSGEIPYEPGQKLGMQRTFVYGQIEVTNTVSGGFGQLSSSTIIAVDDTSISRYPPRPLQRATRLEYPSRAWHLAWWLLGRYAYPRLRAETVTVSAAESTDSARWAFVCAVEVGDLVTVNRRPMGAPTISIRCRVLRVQRRFAYGAAGTAAQVTLTLAAAPPLVPIANDSTYGPISGTVLGA